MAEILGTFEQAVLLSIIRLKDEAYGRGILRELGTRLGREVSPGAVQATLERLENKGMVRSWVGSGTPVRAGRPRRFYRVEPAGVTALNEARSTVEDLWRGLRWPLSSNSAQRTRVVRLHVPVVAIFQPPIAARALKGHA